MIALAILLAIGAPATASAGTSYTPVIRPAEFTRTIDNPYFPLPTRARWTYVAETPHGTERSVVKVTALHKKIVGVACVVVRDTVTLNGSIIEDTYDWYAQHRDGTVWYFGEDTKEYKSGRVTSTKGSWTAGVHGAKPGIVMPAIPAAGFAYRQEYLRGRAEDEARVMSVTASETVANGSYENLVQTEDFSALEPKVVEHKYYARGVGLVLEVTVRGGSDRGELVAFTTS